ncbi:peptidase family C78-domain-containing protein [Trametes meyenii]|nr:peptidase family C78-domain-containing protein [Trametes meyenii]
MKGGYVEDDVEFVAYNHPNKTICQLCSEDLTAFPTPKRQLHYEAHFSDQPAASGSSAVSSDKSFTWSKSRFKPPSHYVQKVVPVEKKNTFWHSSQMIEPPFNFTPGLIPVLKKALIKSHEKGNTRRAWLAFERSVHIGSQVWDKTWGCGYRNYLMACAALMDQQQQPLYFPLLDAPKPPGIRNMQETMEEAWRNGFDREGASQLENQLVDTSKWIGTADIYVAFTYRGIPAQLVDFDNLAGGVEPLLQWIRNYFSGGEKQPKSTTVEQALRGASPVVVTNKMPIVLQHEGHSRTIVGCEVIKDGIINLLTFDPAKKPSLSIRNAGLRNHNPTRQSESSKTFHKVLHPVETIKSKKRKSAPESPSKASGSTKRKRPSDPGEIIVIESDSEQDERPSGSTLAAAQSGEPNPGEVLKFFRIDAKSLRKKDKYQILYFPLDDPLTEKEKLRRRVVTSEKVS